MTKPTDIYPYGVSDWLAMLDMNSYEVFIMNTIQRQ